MFLGCAASLVMSRTAKYAPFLEILRASNLNILLCRPKIDFLRDHQIVIKRKLFIFENKIRILPKQDFLFSL